MNIYVVVEGSSSEKKIYSSWIPFLNSTLTQVNSVNEAENNNFYILAGQGYPSYLSIIENAIEDVCSMKRANRFVFQRLVTCVDSEDCSYEEKHAEIKHLVSEKLAQLQTHADVRIVIQHFCIEAWALANRKIFTANSEDAELNEFLRFYDVRNSDPSGLPSFPALGLNRSQLAERYLRRAINSHHRNLTYTKRNPGMVCDEKFFNRIKSRFESTSHIRSFADLTRAFGA